MDMELHYNQLNENGLELKLVKRIIWIIKLKILVFILMFSLLLGAIFILGKSVYINQPDNMVGVLSIAFPCVSLLYLRFLESPKPLDKMSKNDRTFFIIHFLRKTIENNITVNLPKPAIAFLFNLLKKLFYQMELASKSLFIFNVEKSKIKVLNDIQKIKTDRFVSLISSEEKQILVTFLITLEELYGLYFSKELNNVAIDQQFAILKISTQEITNYDIPNQLKLSFFDRFRNFFTSKKVIHILVISFVIIFFTGFLYSAETKSEISFYLTLPMPKGRGFLGSHS
ncbi:hypothetical protein EEL31_10510 [Brevibacillus laterosporus]|nr:hypothetical protein [Brevibacillus laterosporus]TPG68917.1 hypothetical protein EEL31_10510 [Brevibacillus laterosporus]